METISTAEMTAADLRQLANELGAGDDDREYGHRELADHRDFPSSRYPTAYGALAGAVRLAAVKLASNNLEGVRRALVSGLLADAALVEAAGDGRG